MTKGTKRPFAKIKGINAKLDFHAVKHNRRPFIFSFTTPQGSVMEMQDSVLVEDAERLGEIFLELIELSQK